MSTNPLNLGHISIPGLARWKVPPLVCAGFDAATGDQVILGRRNNNQWEVRGPNPYSSNSTTLLTHIVKETAHFADSSTLTYHLLWAYDDWQAGDVGKTGMGNNLFYSTDDGATWTAITAYSDVLDVITTRSLVTTGVGAVTQSDTLILHDGGTALTWRTNADVGGGTKLLPGVLGDGKTIALPLVGTGNRAGGVQTDDRRSGGVVYYHCWTFDETRISAVLFTWNDSVGSPTATQIATTTVSYPGSQSLPWEGLRFDSDVNFPGDIDFCTGPGEHIYVVRIKAINSFPALPTSLVVTGPTILVNNAATLTMNLANYLTNTPQLGANQSPAWLAQFRSNRPLIFVNLPGVAIQSGLLDGTEAVWDGVAPAIAGITPLASAFSGTNTNGGTATEGYVIDPYDDTRILSTNETGSFIATIFLGAQPGEGSDPAYTALRLVDVVRHNASGNPVRYYDDSGLLDFGGGRYTVQARTSLSTPLDSSGSHWWNRVP